MSRRAHRRPEDWRLARRRRRLTRLCRIQFQEPICPAEDQLHRRSKELRDSDYCLVFRIDAAEGQPVPIRMPNIVEYPSSDSKADKRKNVELTI